MPGKGKEVQGKGRIQAMLHGKSKMSVPRGKGKGAQCNGREGGAVASLVDSIVDVPVSASRRTPKPFAAEEDEKIREHVKIHGTSKWAELGKELQRPGAAVAVRWRKVLDPALEREVGGKPKPFAAEEDEKIREHVKIHGTSKWAELGRELQRPGEAVAQRWREVLDPALEKEVGGKPKRFEAEEDEKIREYVEIHGTSKWAELGRELQRPGGKVAQRWRKVLDPALGKEVGGKPKPFAAEEDEKIREHVKIHRTSKWAELGRELQRPGEAVAQRWREVLDPALEKEVGGKPKRFAAEEDEKIREYVEIHGTSKWAELGRELQRPGGKVAQRWREVLAKTAHVCPHARRYCGHERPCAGCLQDEKTSALAAWHAEWEATKDARCKKDVQRILDVALSLRPVGPPPPEPTFDLDAGCFLDDDAVDAYFAYAAAQGRARRKMEAAFVVEKEYGCKGVVDALLQEIKDNTLDAPWQEPRGGAAKP